MEMPAETSSTSPDDRAARDHDEAQHESGFEQQQQQQQQAMPGPMPGPMPMPPPDPAQSFLWGAHNLFAGLHAVNARLVALEQAQAGEGAHTDLAAKLHSLRSFAVSVLRRLEAHEAFIHDDRFLQGVDQRAYETVVSKCLPEIWTLRAGVDSLRIQVDALAKTQATTATAASPSSSSPASLAKDVENVLLRLAAFGDERVQHLEIIGESGKRYKDGTARRKLVSEPVLAAGVEHPKLPVPSAWKADSDARTINRNFEQLSKMINEVVLTRIDSVEINLEHRLARVEKRVDVLQSLFQSLSREVRAQTETGTSPAAVKTEGAGATSQSTEPDPQASREQLQSPEGETSSPSHVALEQTPAAASETDATASASGEPVSSTTSLPSRSETSTICLSSDQGARENVRPENDAAKTPISGPASVGQQIGERPKKSHLSGAKAGRAAFNRAKESQQKR